MMWNADPERYSEELAIFRRILAARHYHALQLAWRGPRGFERPFITEDELKSFDSWLRSFPVEVQTPIRLFYFHEDVLTLYVERVFPSRVIDALQQLGILEVELAAARCPCFWVVNRLDLTLFAMSLGKPDKDAVYLGAESYGFVQHVYGLFGRVLDLGCGTGILGLAAARQPDVREVWLTDSNPRAVWLTRLNAVRGAAHAWSGAYAGANRHFLAEALRAA
ncbi:MAG: methyltransferase [Candidatus Schekmanbacteria bacterium]|nr:methyltransferase [Candidatus Schekmanbacteria bacterium]